MIMPASNEANKRPLRPDETLHGHISQIGLEPGQKRLETFQEALKLRETPSLYGQENVKPAVAHVKFFDPCGSWTWYATEWDGQNLCFGYVVGHEGEWGYFDLSELAEHRGPMGIGIEVDEHFLPNPVKETERNLSQGPSHDFGPEPGD